VGGAVRVLNTDITIQHLTFDLGKPWESMEAECDRLADGVFAAAQMVRSELAARA
jgi:hypothetical protein